MKRALVLSSGAFAGAYNAGVAATLCRRLGADYFDAIYACSSSTFTAVLYAANQPEIIELVWREYTDGKKMFNIMNPLYGRNMLDLEYIVSILLAGRTKLDVDKIFSSPTVLKFVVMERDSRRVRYISPTRETVFDTCRASSAAPLVHVPVLLEEVWYRDGALADPFPIMQAVRDRYEEIIGVSCRSANEQDTKLGKFIWKTIITLFGAKEDLHEQDNFLLGGENRNQMLPPVCYYPIKASVPLPLRSHWDTDKDRLNKTFDLGIVNAEKFLARYTKKPP